MARHGKPGKRTIAILGWTAGCFLGLQAVLALVAEAHHPEVFDAEAHAQFKLLRVRRAEAAGRPLLLVLGSSRFLTDFRPERLPELHGADGQQVWAFNYSHSGAGPLFNLMKLQGLLREGIRPRWLVVEVMPAFLSVSGKSGTASCAHWQDRPLLCRYMSPWKFLAGYLKPRLLPSWQQRQGLLEHWLPSWAGTDRDLFSYSLATHGGSTLLDRDTDELDVTRQTAKVKAQYHNGLQLFAIRPDADQALRELVELCRREGIDVVLVVSPESSEFRQWYHPTAQKELAAYLADFRISQEIPLIDARAWLPDAEFVDGHHANGAGAVRFTQRLARKVLEPLIKGSSCTLPNSVPN